MVTMQETVGRLVAERPGRSRVFEEFGIDYCCGGKRPLAEACQTKGVDPSVVLRKLEAMDAASAEAGTNWISAPLDALCHHIETTHHAVLKCELPRLEVIIDKVARVHRDRHPELFHLQVVFERFAAELQAHMAKEERVLFPMIRHLVAGGSAPNSHILTPMRVMEAEHDDAGTALQEIRRLTNDFQPPADACNTYRAAFSGLAELEQDMHRHVHKENNILFPRVEQMVRRPVMATR